MPEITVTDYDGLEVDAESRAVTVTLYDGGPGPVGPQGEQGEVGPAGPAGADGAPGAPGAPGADGDDGASAYEVATANGFVGTEAAWLASLVGPEGQQGQEGPQGIQGPPGADGADGAPGVGVPTGGATGQLLAKNSATDYDTEWVDAPTGGGGGSELGWFVVTEYGATGDGTTDDTTAINSAIAALNTAGRGVLYFPAGHYRVTAGLTTITVPCQILGDGPADTLYVDAVTEIRCTSATAHLFTIGAGANGVLIQNLSLKNTASTTPTAGSGIRMNAGEGFRIRDVSTYGFWIGIDVEDGREWYMHGCYFYGPVKYGLRVAHADLPDGGDAAVTECQFVALNHNADAAIYQVSGGGLKVTNVKINGLRPGDGARFTYGIDISIAATTGVLVLSTLSIENVTANPLRVRCTSGSMQGIIIDGIQTAFYDAGTSSAIAIDSVRDVSLSGLVLMTTTDRAVPAITINSVTNCVVGDRVIRGFSSAYSETASVGVVDGMSSATNVEAVQDIVDSMIVAGTNITKTYDDGAGTLTLAASGGSGGAATDVSFTPTGSIASTNVQDAIEELALEAGGGDSVWTETLNLPLTSTSGWASGSGTWSADSSGIRQSVNSDTVARLRYSTKVPNSYAVIQFDVSISSVGAGGRAGLLIHTDAAAGTTGGDALMFRATSAGGPVDNLYLENDGLVAGASYGLPTTYALGSTLSVRLCKSGTDYDVWINGTYITNVRVPYDYTKSRAFVGLTTYRADATFSNLKVWTPALPA